MNTETEILVKALNGFFYIYLPKQKCFSKNTVDSYKAAFKLFLDYMLEQNNSSLSQMSLDDFNKDNLAGFMDWLMTVRQNSPVTCNQRLMAFRSFAKYLGIRDFALTSVYANICKTPTKKTAARVVDFLSEEALKTLLMQPDTSNRTGIRNQCFMCLMYDTAARCQELLDIRLKDLFLNGNAPFVYLTGKGNKTRAVPLMKVTVNHLQRYLKLFHPDYGSRMDDYLFYTTSHGERHPMSRDTVQVFMKNYSRRFAWSRSFQFLGITLFSAYDPKCRIRHLGSTSTMSTFLPSMARPTPRFSQVVVLPVPPFWLVMAITVAFWAKSSPPFTPAGAGYFAFRSCCTRAA